MADFTVRLDPGDKVSQRLMGPDVSVNPRAHIKLGETCGVFVDTVAQLHALADAAMEAARDLEAALVAFDRPVRDFDEEAA